MSERRQDRTAEAAPPGVNPGYAAFQIAKALRTSEEHGDAETRARARERVATWEKVLGNILRGTIAYGSRTPVGGVPAWATLEVVTGGFATGRLLAGGPLQEHERALLQQIPGVPDGEERRALNAYFLADAGLAELDDRLRDGRYDVGVPEEGALLVAAWLVAHGHVEDARTLLQEISSHLPLLRFYPIPLEQEQYVGSRVHLQDVGRTLDDLRRIAPNERVLEQKEAIEIWLPIYDRIVALFLETVENGWPCQSYPDGWRERARTLLATYGRLRDEHPGRAKLHRTRGHAAQLRVLLAKCASEPSSLTGREVGRIRQILAQYVAKRGTPDSARCAAARTRQTDEVSAPTHHAVAQVVIARLTHYPARNGLDDVGPLTSPVSDAEADAAGIRPGTAVPSAIQRKVERCLNETVETLVRRGLITSGETLARVLPQMISGIRAAGIEDPALRRLYAAIYRAFRRRRSLLLLNLEKQVQIEELPWIAAIERFRSDDLSKQDLSRQALEEIVVLTLTSFSHALLPNKLLREMRALVRGAALDIPLTDELAADIFMGAFSPAFVKSAHRAAALLEGSLYAAYYGIDYATVRRIRPEAELPRRLWLFGRESGPGAFAQLCASRAGVALGTWKPAVNGMVIEQQQILTTHNLAALFAGLELRAAVAGQLDSMARECFRWVCARHTMKVNGWHARLIMVKNTAYAWRQMIFWLALLPEGAVAEFLAWAGGHLDRMAGEPRRRLRVALDGVALAAAGGSPDGPGEARSGVPQFLGWSVTTHWMLRDASTP